MRSRARTFVLSSGLLLATACGDEGDADTGAADTVALDTGATGPGTAADASGDPTAASATAATDPSSDTGNDAGNDTSGTSDADSSGGGSDEASSTGAAPSGPQWAITEIAYAGAAAPQLVSFDDCSFCDATLDGPLLVRFQQAEGWTVWSITIPSDSIVGSQPLTPDYTGAYAVINEHNPELDPAYHGFYDATMASGTLTLTEATIEHGGAVAGTLQGHFVLGEATADLSAEFYAEIP
ncbi:MAG: hypothetical protein JNK45_07050 [Myxococcales bacterium]|jgi:hypothetical protein|nr:hypothetical protein [Myxococcales bacterium]